MIFIFVEMLKTYLMFLTKIWIYIYIYLKCWVEFLKIIKYSTVDCQIGQGTTLCYLLFWITFVLHYEVTALFITFCSPFFLLHLSLLAPHDHTFRFMITFTSCFTMFLGHGWWTFPKCRGQTLLLPLHRPLILRMPPTLGLCPTYNELPRK
jgi:hypothetical protein